MPLLRLLLGLALLGACAPDVSARQESLSSEAWTSLSAAAQEQVETSQVPVLLFPAEYAPMTQVITGPTWYALHAPTEELTVMLHATSVVHHELNGEARPTGLRIRGNLAYSGMNEGIRHVTWEEDGTFYTVEVECRHEPLSDRRCIRQSFAVDIAERMVEVAR